MLLRLRPASKSPRFIRAVILSIALSIHSTAAAHPEWMHEQILEDLAPYQEKRICIQDIEKTLELSKNKSSFPWHLIQVEVKQGKLLFHPDSEQTKGLDCYEEKTETLSTSIDPSSLPDMVFLFTLHDGFTEDISKEFPAPIFTYSKKKHSSGTVCIPDFEAIEGHSTLQEALSQDIPWVKKRKQLFWRGSSTGGLFTQENCLEYPRSQLVLLSKRFPRYINAFFTSYCQYVDPDFPQFFSKYCPLRPRVSVDRQLKYRYLIDVDGNACTFSRMYWILRSNSVLFKQVSENTQWYYKAVQPWQHFIPVAKDLSDLPQKIRWAIHHDKQAHEIAKNATELVPDIFSRESIKSYVQLLLESYSQLFDSK